MKEHWAEIKKFLKFGITGVMNTVVDFAVYTVLVSLTGMGLYVPQVISYCCGMLNSYIVNRKWTFDTQNGFFSLELVKFIVLNLAMMLLGMGIIYLCVEQMGFHKLAGKLVSTVLVMAINFVVSNLWVFRNKNKGKQTS